MEHGLYIIATPIGNLGDITYRALGILKEAEIVACEDTRVTKKLFSLLGVDLNKKFITYQDHNEEECSPKILEIWRGGQFGQRRRLPDDFRPRIQTCAPMQKRRHQSFFSSGRLCRNLRDAAFRTSEQPLYVCRIYSEQRQRAGKAF